jgi:hypothetical protein
MNAIKNGVELQRVWGGARRVINERTSQKLLSWVRVCHDGLRPVYCSVSRCLAKNPRSIARQLLADDLT